MTISEQFPGKEKRITLIYDAVQLSKELARQIGIKVQNIYLLKPGKVKDERVETLAHIRKALDEQSGDIQQYDAPAVKSEPDPDY